MRFSKNLLLLSFAFSTMFTVRAQFADTLLLQPSNQIDLASQVRTALKKDHQSIGPRSFIAPGILMVYGVASLEVGQLKSFNAKVKEEVWMERPHKKTTIDNYLMYSPAVAVYGLNALGIKGKNNFRDRSIIYLMSNAFLTSSVFGIKKLTNELRPDGTDYYSFPSGHTAEAFASAEFLRQEYKDVSPWYGIAGYLVAGTTGALRMYNNRH